MKLSKLMFGYEYDTKLSDIEIKGVTSDSRLVEKGSVFVCIKGVKSDGHDYAQKAVEQGAAAVITERDLGLDKQIIISDSRKAYGGICGNYFGNPASKLKMIGITGTNGKTTCTYLIKSILEHCGKKVGLIGTIHNEIGEVVLPARHTTPDPFYLHGMLSSMLKNECEYVIMEVSSHALDQHRLEGIAFEAGVYTNLSQDHLDYHHDMESYYEAKKKLFDISQMGIINLDDSYGERLCKEAPCKIYSYSKENNEADFVAKDVKGYPAYSKFAFVGEGIIFRMTINMPGGFSVQNAMAAASCALALGFEPQKISEGLIACGGVRGRTEVIHSGEFTVIRDYAHSPDSLEKLLTTVREFAKGKIVLVFGCPGERDRSKRKYMGEAAEKYSDYMVIAEDNPRSEPQKQIAEDIILGFSPKNKRYKVIDNRYLAIKWALEKTEENDILILAGKGHEDYQVLNDATHYFDEREIVKSFIAEQKK